MDSTAELALILKAKNMASREVDKLHGSLDKVSSKAKGAGNAIRTFGKIAAGVALVGILAFGATLVKATRDAIAEEKNIVALTAAIKANDKGFKGSIAGIEAVIASREKLAFSDDDLRASLTILVTKYKDTNKALALQRTAMDLARLKGISLQDASTLLGRALDGNAKALKTLGITLPKTATEHQRLAAIQKAAAGQAEAYGKTTAGAFESAQIAIDDVFEDIGQMLLPVLTTLAVWIRDKGIPALRDIGGKVQAWIEKNKPLINQIKNVLLVVLGKVADILGTIAEKIGEVIGWIGKMLDSISEKDAKAFRDWIGSIEKKFGDVADSIADAVNWLKELLGLQKKVNIARNLHSGGSSGFSSGNADPDYANTRRVPGPLGKPIRITAHGGEKVRDAGPDSRGRAGGFTIQGVSERDILAMVDKGLYFRLRRAAPAGGRA